VISQPRGVTHPRSIFHPFVLAQSTGRRTVPNVLVSGKSIGGGDDIAALDQRDPLSSLPGLWTMAIT
jgi:hypothetical protein